MYIYFHCLHDKTCSQKRPVREKLFDKASIPQPIRQIKFYMQILATDVNTKICEFLCNLKPEQPEMNEELRKVRKDLLSYFDLLGFINLKRIKNISKFIL